MMNLQTNKIATDAVIHLKDGRKKYGTILQEIGPSDDLLFISNTSIPHFSESFNKEYMEVVPGVLIEAIETDLK